MDYTPIDISWSEMIAYIIENTGINENIVETVLQWEELFLRNKGVIIETK